MTKIILLLVLVAIVLLLFRRARIRLMPKGRRPQAKSEFAKQLNVILWIPPVLVGLGVIYLLFRLIFPDHN